MAKELFYLISWILVAFGWIISFSLAFSTFKRGEVRKAVDAIVDNIEKCSSVSLKAWSDKSTSEGMLDQEISALISRISIYEKIVEKKSGRVFLKDSDYVRLYDISSGFFEVHDLPDSVVSEKIQESDMVCSNLIYELENAYYDYSMSGGALNFVYNFPVRHPDMFGAGLAFLLLVSIYAIASIFA